MTSFTDRNGREWHPEITVPALRDACRHLGLRVEQLMKLLARLPDFQSDDPMVRRAALDAVGLDLDPGAFMELPWFACRREAAGRKVDQEGFLEALGPRELGAAFRALGACLQRDFPQGDGSSGADEGPFGGTKA